MPVGQLVLGAVLVFLGSGMMLARRRIAAHHRPPRESQRDDPLLWLFLGLSIGMFGAMQLLLAAA